MKKGFTLIELLVVVLIIGILSAVALPKYQKAVERAKGVEALTTSKSLQDALNVYYLENGRYNSGEDMAGLSIEIPELKNWDIGTNGFSCNCGSDLESGCQSNFCRFKLCGDYQNYIASDTGTGKPVPQNPQVSLEYTLIEGKTICRCCGGPKCQNYFGVQDGEQF